MHLLANLQAREQAGYVADQCDKILEDVHKGLPEHSNLCVTLWRSSTKGYAQ